MNSNLYTQQIQSIENSLQSQRLPVLEMVIKNGLQPPPPPPTGSAPDARAKQVLKEAVDAVVNSFAKHTQGYGRGMYCSFIYFIYQIVFLLYSALATVSYYMCWKIIYYFNYLMLSCSLHINLYFYRARYYERIGWNYNYPIEIILP